MKKLQAIQALIAGVFARTPLFRQDAGYDTMFLARELTQIESEQYKVEYEDLTFRQHIPIKNSGLNPGAKFFVYKIWDYFGMAKWITDYADDLPRVGLRVTEEMSKSHPFGDSYGWSADELMQASMAGIALEREEANAAFEFCERFMDDKAYNGDGALNMVGFLNHPNVSVGAPAANGNQNGGSNSRRFDQKLPLQILADLHAASQLGSDRSKKKFAFNTLMLPPTLHGLIATTPISAEVPMTTILDVFLAKDPYIKSVVSGPSMLETAGADGGPRMVFYSKNPKWMQVYIPMEPKAVPPQERNLAVVVNVWAKFGGFILRQFLAMHYVDGAGPVPS